MWSANAVVEGCCIFLWFEIVKMSLRVLILFNVCMCTIWEYDVITLVFSKEERRHKSYKICIVDKSFIQLQFHEANILIVHFFGQLTKGIFYNLKIPTLSCFRRHKDLKLLLNLLAETSGVPQFFLQLYLLAQKKMMIHSGRHLCWTISIPHNIPIWICSHPISMLSIYLTTWRQVCQSHFEFSPSLTKSFNPSGNHRLGQYVFASEYFDLHILVLSETTPSFAESAIWRIRDSDSKPKGKRAFFKIVAKQLFRSLDFSPSPLQMSLLCS